MTDEQINEMVKNIVAAVDYDIHNSIYVEGCIECPEEATDRRKQLLAIAKKFLRS